MRYNAWYAMQAQNGVLSLEQLKWPAGWLGGDICVATCMRVGH